MLNHTQGCLTLIPVMANTAGCSGHHWTGHPQDFSETQIFGDQTSQRHQMHHLQQPPPGLAIALCARPDAQRAVVAAGHRTRPAPLKGDAPHRRLMPYARPCAARSAISDAQQGCNRSSPTCASTRCCMLMQNRPFVPMKAACTPGDAWAAVLAFTSFAHMLIGRRQEAPECLPSQHASSTPDLHHTARVQ